MQTRFLALVVLAAGCAAAPTSVATPPHAPGAPPSAPAGVAADGAPAREAPPTLLVHVDAPDDPERRLASVDQERLRAIVQEAIARGNYATAWPGGLPTAADLAIHGARAFIVAATVERVAIADAGGRASIECSVMIRIAPWRGIDGGEHWETATAAMATGRAHATTPRADADAGVRDCVLEVGQAVTTREILPFLARVETAPADDVARVD